MLSDMTGPSGSAWRSLHLVDLDACIHIGEVFTSERLPVIAIHFGRAYTLEMQSLQGAHHLRFPSQRGVHFKMCLPLHDVHLSPCFHERCLPWFCFYFTEVNNTVTNLG